MISRCGVVHTLVFLIAHPALAELAFKECGFNPMLVVAYAPETYLLPRWTLTGLIDRVEAEFTAGDCLFLAYFSVLMALTVFVFLLFKLRVATPELVIRDVPVYPFFMQVL